MLSLLGAGYITAGFGRHNLLCSNCSFYPHFSVVVSLMHRVNLIKLPVEPLHHTLHYNGLSEKIVALYWSITLVICLLAILIYQFVF